MSDTRNFATAHESNLLFQSEKHPLVTEQPASFEEFCLSLIHQKAYEEAAAIAKGKIVLDIGCNHGYGTARIAETASRTTGVDVSAQSISVARARYQRSNLEFRLTTGETLPFPTASFDCVFGFQVIEHVVDCSAFLSELRRVLRPGGVTVLTTPNREIRLDPGMRPWNPFHVTEFSASELSDLLKAYFPEVEVQGLFAPAPIYESETSRVGRARARARRPALSSAVRTIQGWCPGNVLSGFRRVFGLVGSSAKGGGGSGEEFSTDDLYYRTDNLNASLDLMAVCRAGAD